MKRLALILLPCFFTTVFASTPPNPADYTVAVHVSSSRTTWVCLQAGSTPECRSLLVLNATIDGTKFELEGTIENNSKEAKFMTYDGFLALGDYKARQLPNKFKDPAVPYFVIRLYELLLPDGRLAQFQVTGQSE